jgi:hypothetical protein
MWADSMITVFTMITVGAKNLKTGRPFVGLEPVVKEMTSEKPQFLPVFVSIICNVVKCHKKGFGFTAASANIATISLNSFILKAIIVAKSNLSASFKMFFVPLYGTLSILCRMLFAVVSYPFNRPQFPFLAILHEAFVTLPSVPTLLILRISTPRTSFNHGLTSIVKSINDYGDNVKGKEQRPSGNGVGASVPKRIATRTVEDMVCSAWEHAAVSFETA